MCRVHPRLLALFDRVGEEFVLVLGAVVAARACLAVAAAHAHSTWLGVLAELEILSNEYVSAHFYVGLYFLIN